MIRTLDEYLAFYRLSLHRSWENLTPTQYGYLLVVIAVVGYLSMRSSR